MHYKIIEIFDSLEGEGTRQGEPTTFIRMYGCNLNCTWCDTRYACSDPSKAKQTSLEQILSECEYGYKNITLTGGEPLLDYNIVELIAMLIKAGNAVNIETNGTVELSEVLAKLEKRKAKLKSGLGTLQFTVDYKLPSSGETDKMLWKNYLNLTEADSIKFVIGSAIDLEHAEKIIKRITEHYIKEKKSSPTLLISTVYGQFCPKELANHMLNNSVFSSVKLQLQLHKQLELK